jgi:hypothetical protein
VLAAAAGAGLFGHGKVRAEEAQSVTPCPVPTSTSRATSSAPSLLVASCALQRVGGLCLALLSTSTSPRGRLGNWTGEVGEAALLQLRPNQTALKSRNRGRG